MKRSQPGLAFWLVCDLGFAVGLVVNRVERMGDLIWLAGPIFDEEPGVESAEDIRSWRWPVFFPVGAALQRNIVTAIGIIEIPEALRQQPIMRDGDKQMGWKAVDIFNSLLPVSATPEMPIRSLVNDTRLKEMLVTGYLPQDVW